MLTDSDDVQGLVFPCTLDIKIFLNSDPDNFTLARELILKHVPVSDLIRISDKSSKKGKYQSLSCKVRAESQGQMDALFQELTSHPKIIMVI